MKKYDQLISKLTEDLATGHLEPIPHYDDRELGDQLINQLKMGIQVEAEHQDLYNLFRNFCKANSLKMPITEGRFYEIIAKAHLREIKDYYSRLKAMEISAKNPTK